MFIQTEQTPNPETLKFIPGEVVLDSGTANFTSLEEAAVSPLASRLLELEGVGGVFLGHDFIAVTREDAVEWDFLKPSVLGHIMEHYTSGQPIMAMSASDVAEDNSDDSPVVTQIKELLETRVRPAVAQDGGDIVFHSFDEEGTVYLRMQGACSGCPSSTATLKYGIQNLLTHYIPEVKNVEAV
ncbi:MAG: NifU family protein [Kordiimonas sp.]|nr:NifU family protein [Kordiimonas sp.]|tara:strand:- start:6240 stop:6791 length:552 start_codon:yes stop_codon:yes gene_type:complete